MATRKTAPRVNPFGEYVEVKAKRGRSADLAMVALLDSRPADSFTLNGVADVRPIEGTDRTYLAGFKVGDVTLTRQKVLSYALAKGLTIESRKGGSFRLTADGRLAIKMVATESI